MAQGRLLTTGCVAVMLACASIGCNAVIGADEPVVTDEPRIDAGPDEDEAGSNAAQASCGNGIIELTEQCDDANDVPGDGCHECEVQCGPLPEMPGSSDWTCYWLAVPAETKSWQDARTFCESWGGVLVTISDDEEFGALQNRITTTTWIGAKFDSSSGSASWIDGAPWSSDAWSDLEKDGEGACVAVHGERHALVRMPCDQALPFICERAPAGVRPDG